MNPHNKDHKDNEPLLIHLGGDDEEEYDDDEVEVIRPRALKSDSHASGSGRGLRNQPIVSEDEEELPPSKSKIKKQMHELRDLGKELTELGKDQIAQLDIPENLRDAIREMKSINKFGAQRRQIQYIGKLMRDVDPAPIIAKLDVWKGKSLEHIAHAHQLERWRERLMESDSALTELLAEYPGTDTQHLRTLIRNAHKEAESGKPPKNFREIYRLLKEIIPQTL